MVSENMREIEIARANLAAKIRQAGLSTKETMSVCEAITAACGIDPNAGLIDFFDAQDLTKLVIPEGVKKMDKVFNCDVVGGVICDQVKDIYIPRSLSQGEAFNPEKCFSEIYRYHGGGKFNLHFVGMTSDEVRKLKCYPFGGTVVATDKTWVPMDDFIAKVVDKTTGQEGVISSQGEFTVYFGEAEIAFDTSAEDEGFFLDDNMNEQKCTVVEIAQDKKSAVLKHSIEFEIPGEELHLSYRFRGNNGVLKNTSYAKPLYTA
ncbi:MAG: hypothetical protein ACI4RT_01800 [Candidatus Spyradenecus sp.]